MESAHGLAGVLEAEQGKSSCKVVWTGMGRPLLWASASSSVQSENNLERAIETSGILGLCL